MTDGSRINAGKWLPADNIDDAVDVITANVGVLDAAGRPYECEEATDPYFDLSVRSLFCCIVCWHFGSLREKIC